VLGLEEIGKVILDIWANDEPLSKPVIRRTAHVRKQAAIGARFICGRKIWWSWRRTCILRLSISRSTLIPAS